MFQHVACPIDNQQPRIGPMGQRGLGDQVAWQFVVVLGEFRHSLRSISQHKDELYRSPTTEYKPRSHAWAGATPDGHRRKFIILAVTFEYGKTRRCTVYYRSRDGWGRTSYGRIGDPLGMDPTLNQSSTIWDQGPRSRMPRAPAAGRRRAGGPLPRRRISLANPAHRSTPGTTPPQARPALIQTSCFTPTSWADWPHGVPALRVVAGLRVAERRRWHLWADRLTSSLVDRYVCVSESVARYSSCRGGLARDNQLSSPTVSTWKNIQRPHSTCNRSGLPQTRVVTFIGRLEGQKGVHWLLKTAPDWLNRLPDCDLLLVGRGPIRLGWNSCARNGDCLPGPLRRLARRHPRSWPPANPRPSSRWEGCLTWFSRPASRLPVVATDAEGVRELLGPDAESWAWCGMATRKALARKWFGSCPTVGSPPILGKPPPGRVRASRSDAWSPPIRISGRRCWRPADRLPKNLQTTAPRRIVRSALTGTALGRSG